MADIFYSACKTIYLVPLDYASGKNITQDLLLSFYHDNDLRMEFIPLNFFINNFLTSLKMKVNSVELFSFLASIATTVTALIIIVLFECCC